MAAITEGPAIANIYELQINMASNFGIRKIFFACILCRNAQSRQTGSICPTDLNSIRAIWDYYMRLHTKYQGSVICNR